MSSTTEYSQTLQHITDAKLEELSNKRNIFLKRKAAALEEAESASSPVKQVRALSDGVKTCFDISVKEDGRVITSGGNRYIETAVSNLDRFLKQAEYDPSISAETLERWRKSMLGLLEVQTLKYEYATLFAQLTMEWLAVKKNPKGSKKKDSQTDDFERLDSAAKLESRKKWEEKVFTPADCDAENIKTFLDDLFMKPLNHDDSSSADDTKSIAKALEKLRKKVENFEKSLADSAQFNTSTLHWVISGLLSSDLVTNSQRAVLRDFQRDSTVLTELADVLNMRLSALHSWSWGAEVIVEQRRQLNGSYQVHMHEDLIQAIFLQYIGVKWSVFFKKTFNDFRITTNVWKSMRSTIPAIDKKRRQFFLDQKGFRDSLQMTKESIHRKAYFVSQLMNHEQHERHQEEGEQEAERRSQPAQAPGRYKKAPRTALASMACRKAVTHEEKEESDEDMGFGLFDDDDDDFDPIQTFDPHWAQEVKIPANQMQAKQNLLLLLSADITINKGLYGEISCFRAQYDSLYPSLPHMTILEVLKFLGVSEKWIGFFERFLTAPLKFADDHAEPRPRRRGTPGAHVLSEVFGETTLFCLDFMINKETNGQPLWRVNDDLWFWSRKQETALAVWQSIERFNKTMGIPLGKEKTGGAYISTSSTTPHPSLPTGKIRWGMLYLNPASGKFEIDQEMVDEHITELQRQLTDKQGSIFGWIQAYNSYASTFFTYNFGTPANCFGQDHVDQMLQTHQRIQREIFPSDPTGTNEQSVITYLRETIEKRFGNVAIPDGYFFLPIDLGGLELNSPFINLLGLRDSVLAKPSAVVEKYLEDEKDAYADLKRRYSAKDKDRLVTKHNGFRPEDIDSFLPFEEYVRHRETLDYGFSNQLVSVYDQLLRRPEQDLIEYDSSGPISVGLGQLRGQNNLSGIRADWSYMSPYWKWVAQLYGPEIVERFGGFNVVDPGLLPIGLVSQFRSGRVSWTEE